MELTDLLIPTYRQMLRTLAGLLDKAQSQMPQQAETLLSARLAGDMYPLASQVRFAALQAQEATFRLRGEAIPDWLEALATEGREAGEKPGPLADAKMRITEALTLLDSMAADGLDGAGDLPITLELPGGIVLDMTGEQYARDWALPQFYFHVVAAYAILRNKGVDLGKADYVPHTSAYLRARPELAG